MDNHPTDPAHDPRDRAAPEVAPLMSIPQLLAWAAVPVLSSVIVIVGALTSTIWLSLIGMAALASYYAWARWHVRKKNPTVTDLLIGWKSSPRPAPQDVVDRHRHP